MIHLRQRRVSERLSEWLDQYTEVSQKQQDHLQRLNDVRQALKNKSNKHVTTTNGPKHKYQRKYPIYAITRVGGTDPNQNTVAPISSWNSIFTTDDKQMGPKLKIAPFMSPRKLAPIVKRFKTNKYEKVNEEIEHRPDDKITRAPEMTKMKTEYEPFESIAKRNRLHLNYFFHSPLNHRRMNERLALPVSTVTIIDDATDL